MKITIKEAKAQLNKVTTLEALSNHALHLDERKGVKQAIRVRQRQLEKELKLEQDYQRMMKYEQEILQQQPDAIICGIDEVGRGPLAGPVVACAVILNANHHYLGLNDSKKVSAVNRAQLNQDLMANVRGYAYGIASAAEIDQLNIYRATQVAMQRAINQLQVRPTHLLIDAMSIDSTISQTAIIKGDAKSVSIAAASIMAKEYRDHLMRDYAQVYPYYGFDKNVGYGTKAHLAGLKQYGVTPIHRRTFEPVKSML
ncbi:MULTISPECIES: ribonuclease HII [Staphylococcus]|uniref:Ribonuclease HII n=1 Tax=Staphylococcus lugdunensis TaxID=28035 RepID=A0ABX6BVR8_STALU|nr:MULTISPECIES: ribonuclease HII [Staphylococcus]ADC87742.1 Ribonuclease HII [Staphylococcus lugdunensis HKU09-01]ARB77980.1 ribonuclease HII [Staphylococcus lugdunensis]ARJ09501.1 ribonuclease HII [Staphylococcus lugdunensis]ARJ16536.1 ribonuclease HII [Staphylococcus lugdunensis]ARJ19099.1 ribonuclease HII [Staphylococcus lugdunensis]